MAPSEEGEVGDRLVVRVDSQLFDYVEEVMNEFDVTLNKVVSEALAQHSLMMDAWRHGGSVIVSVPGKHTRTLDTSLARR
jgi:hypothetical protein